jgi:hypothetical protein
MVNPFHPVGRLVVAIRRSGRRFSSLVSSGAPTNLNSDRGEKFRGDEWLISAMLREVNQLQKRCSAKHNRQLTNQWDAL